MRFGYACLNGTLRDEGFKRKRLLKKDFDADISNLIPVIDQNLNMVLVMIEWNENNGLKLLRVTDLFPWMDKYKFEDLPNWVDFKLQLEVLGHVATELDHRITVHPSSFCVLASPSDKALAETILELNQNGLLFDYMGFDKTPHNKINIHVGGTYNDKQSTLDRFCLNFEKSLNDSTKHRLTIENDDRKSGFTVEELYHGIHKKIGIPIVMDLFHHQLNPGNLTEQEALELALSTWPDSIKPIVHISSSKKDHEDPEASVVAHADYIHRGLPLFPREVDVMVEAKRTELAALKLMRETDISY